ncbi:hypothetical protein [Carnimonas bestiolae]|uniref:hypothetical protein n=1 Tax=Carnimonas bestiolae TaxID=3402172 RepID=UPI003EDC8C5D
MSIDWPEGLHVSSMDWGVVSNELDFTSTLTNGQQIVELPGAYWRCKLEFSLRYTEERLLTQLLGRLRGRVNTVRVYDWLRPYTGGDQGKATVSQSTNQAYVISSAGWTKSKTVLPAGAYVMINGQLLELVEDVKSDSQGRASMTFNMRLRTNANSGTAIEYRNPYCTMRRSESESLLSRESKQSTFTLEMREAF